MKYITGEGSHWWTGFFCTKENSIFEKSFTLGDITVTEENVQDLIVAADMVEVKEIVHICTHFIKQQLTPSNCIGILRYNTSIIAA